MIKKLKFFLTFWLTIPHVMMYIISRRKDVIRYDVKQWAKCCQMTPIIRGGKCLTIILLMQLLLRLPEYRNVFYLRIGRSAFFLKYLRPMSTLYICTRSEDFGAGTFIQHGFATVITAEHIGRDCWINQQVTIGYNSSKKYGYGKPWIGNNVRVSAGAKVVGNIHVGDGSVVGVNAVVCKDVPAHSTIIPAAMQIIDELGNKRQF